MQQRNKLTIIALNSKDFDKLPYKYATKTRGLAIPAKNKAYIRVTKNYFLDRNIIHHELEELINDSSAHEIDGVRYGPFDWVGDIWEGTKKAFTRFGHQVSEAIPREIKPYIPAAVSTVANMMLPGAGVTAGPIAGKMLGDDYVMPGMVAGATSLLDPGIWKGVTAGTGGAGTRMGVNIPYGQTTGGTAGTRGMLTAAGGGAGGATTGTGVGTDPMKTIFSSFNKLVKDMMGGGMGKTMGAGALLGAGAMKKTPQVPQAGDIVRRYQKEASPVLTGDIENIISAPENSRYLADITAGIDRQYDIAEEDYVKKMAFYGHTGRTSSEVRQGLAELTEQRAREKAGAETSLRRWAVQEKLGIDKQFMDWILTGDLTTIAAQLQLDIADVNSFRDMMGAGAAALMGGV